MLAYYFIVKHRRKKLHVNVTVPEPLYEQISDTNAQTSGSIVLEANICYERPPKLVQCEAYSYSKVIKVLH